LSIIFALILVLLFILLHVHSLWAKPFVRCSWGIVICLLLTLILNHVRDLTGQREFFLSALFLLACLEITIFYYLRIRETSIDEKRRGVGNLVLAAIIIFLIMLPLRKSSLPFVNNRPIDIVFYSITFFLFAFIEELTFRYLPMNQFITLARFDGIIRTRPNIRDIATILLSSLLFSFVHFDITPSVLVGHLFFGILMCLLYLTTKRLWLLVLVHGIYKIFAMQNSSVIYTRLFSQVSGYRAPDFAPAPDREGPSLYLSRSAHRALPASIRPISLCRYP
jgi:membrane protease YdiL (CAAX protease family)